MVGQETTWVLPASTCGSKPSGTAGIVIYPKKQQ